MCGIFSSEANERMAAGLLSHTMSGIDQYKSNICSAGAGVTMLRVTL